MTIGPIFLVVVLLAALGGAVAAFLVIRGDRSNLTWMRWLTWITLGFAAGASLLLLALILTQRYDFAYVYQYTSQNLAFGYRLSAFWAGQQGSFLLWLLLAAVFTVLQFRRARQFEPYVVFFLLLVQAGLAIFLLVDSPFRSLGRVVSDGFGMNPLLQNPWMVTHPPVLFVGYAGLAVPFAYALAALWRRDYDQWVSLALPWTLVAWLFLGAGIYLGAYWAYETLGWGGYWGWDLVENSSLIPWLTGTALLHGLLIQRYRKRLRHGNLMLAIGTFFLVLYATYLTRSGILSEISTHSFVETGLTPWMVGLLLATLASGVGFLAARWRDIPRSPVLAGKEKEPVLEGDVAGTVGRSARTWLSRDFTFLLTLLILLMITAPIWFGTLTPVVTKLLQGTPTKVDESFYPTAAGPWALAMLAVLCLCPFLGWQESSWKRLRGLLIAPAVAAILAVIAAVLLGAREPYALLYILLAAFALLANIVMIVRVARGGILRMGGYLTHVGVGLAIVGIVATSFYNVDGPSLALVEGQPQETLGYQVTFVGWQETPGEKPALRLEVERGAERFIALPQLYENPQDGSLMATPHIQRNLAYDVYIAAEGYEPGQGQGMVQVAEEQTVLVAGYELTLEALVPRDRMVDVFLTVDSAGQRSVVTTTYPISDVDAPYQPVALPGGGMLTIVQVDLAPAGLFWVGEAAPVAIGPYQARLLDFTMEPHDSLTDTIAAGAVVEFTGPEGIIVITPTQVVGPEEIQTPGVELAPGITVRLVRMAVEQREAQIQVEGIAMVPQVTLQVEGAGSSAGVAYVHVSVKPGMNLLWLGGALLLLGTSVAVIRRWLEARRPS